ncbi:MAG TPA: amidohydrolase family protein [Acidimicrobiia bacterium]
MSEPQTAARALPYLINDADEHSTPNFSAYERYIDPDKKDMAIRIERGDSGRSTVTYNGRPARFTFKNFQVVGSNEQLAEVGVKDLGASDDMGGQVIPGSLLTRLNPLKELDAEGRKEFARRYRELQPQLDNPADRLTVMDAQGIQCAVNYAAIPGMEVEFEDDFDGLYANLVALNRYLGTEWGYNYEQRLYTPPFVSFADPDAALMLLEEIMKIEVPKVIQTSTGPSMHTSPFRPENDRFWSICSEAGIKLCTHLATVTRYGAQGLEWNEEEVMLGDMDAFQWAFYYGDRPAMETVGAAILQGWFARFPQMQLLLSEQGTVWVPYTVRKLDHAFLMGRRATWGTLDRRPSDYFKDHCFVAPFPEENVDRVVEVVGTKPLTFGSDFPHGEGLPEPEMYLGQLKNLGDDDTKAIMRDNLARFLDLPA